MVTITRPETLVELCIDASLQAEWEAACEALRQAQQDAVKDARETGEPRALRDAKAAVRDIEARMHEHMIVFTLRGLPRKRFTEIETQHPPREGNAADETFGLNLEAALDVLFCDPGTIAAVHHKPTGEPVEFDATTEWVALADEMTQGQFDPFARAVLGVNRAQVTPGFNRAAYIKTRS